VAIYSHWFPYIAGYIFHVPLIADSWSTSITGMAGPLGRARRSALKAKAASLPSVKINKCPASTLGATEKNAIGQWRKNPIKKAWHPDFNSLRSGKSPSWIGKLTMSMGHFQELCNKLPEGNCKDNQQSKTGGFDGRYLWQRRSCSIGSHSYNGNIMGILVGISPTICGCNGI